MFGGAGSVREVVRNIARLSALFSPEAMIATAFTGLMPDRYPSDEEIEARCREVVGNTVGLTPHPYSQTLPEAFKNHLINMKLLHPDFDKILSNQFERTWKAPGASEVHWNRRMKHLFTFLGYGGETSFLVGMKERIKLYLVSKRINYEKFEKELNFADQAYKRGDHPKRLSGESYLCHPLRMVWNFLTLQKESGVFGSEENNYLSDMVTVFLYHDILEDVPDARLLETVDGGNGNRHYYLDAGKGLKREISHRVYETLEAVRAENKQEYLAKAAYSDSNGMAAAIKLYDRLDNLFTLWYHDDWPGAFRVLVESITSLGTLGWVAGFSQPNKALKNLGSLILEHKNRHIVGPAMLSYGMYLSLVEGFRQKFRDDVRKYRGINLEPADLESWYLGEVAKKDNVGARSVASRLSLKSIYNDYFHPVYSYHRNLPGWEPLSFKHILPYLNRVAGTIDLESKQYYFPGMAYDMLRPISVQSRVVKSIRTALNRPSLPTEIHRGIASVVLYENKKNEKK